MPVTKVGKGGTRKINRMGRKPAHVKYNASRRWERNKIKKIAKAAKGIKEKSKAKGDPKQSIWNSALGKVEEIYEKNHRLSLTSRRKGK